MSGAHPLSLTLQTLTAQPRLDGLAPVVVLTSALSQSGTSHVSREIALLAAGQYVPQGGRVGLIDLDINNQSQQAWFERPAPMSRYGSVSGPYAATFGQMPFWQVSPDMISASGERAHTPQHCGLYVIGQTGLVVSKFDWGNVKSGQTVHIIPSPDYWQAIRSHFSLVFVDTPAFERSDMAMNVIPYADKTLLVSSEHRQQDPAHGELAQRIQGTGGTVAGLVLNAGIKAQAYSGYMS